MGYTTCLGSNTDISVPRDQSAPNTPISNRTPAFTYCSPNELSSRLSQFADPRSPNGYISYSAGPSGKSPNPRDYDSDTGYRSETEFIRLRRQHMVGEQGFVRGGYESDRDGFTPRKDRQREVGYSSDVEGYSGRVKVASYRSGPTPIHKTGSVQYNVNQNGSSPVYTAPHLNRTARVSGGAAPQDKVSEPSARSLEASVFSDSAYNPPSPMFHHSKIVDQSTPVTSEAPNGFGFRGRSQSGSDSGSASQEDPGKNADWRRDFYAVMEQKMSSSQTQLNQQVNTPIVGFLYFYKLQNKFYVCTYPITGRQPFNLPAVTDLVTHEMQEFVTGTIYKIFYLSIMDLKGIGTFNIFHLSVILCQFVQKNFEAIN